MKQLSLAVLFLFLQVCFVSAQELDPRLSVSSDILKNIVSKYLAAREATMREHSSSADIDKLLSFYISDIVYEHPRVKARIEGIENIRKGMSKFLGTSRNPKITTVNTISAVNVVVVEYRMGFQAKNGDDWENVARTQVTLFEFEGRRIKRVVDYW